MVVYAVVMYHHHVCAGCVAPFLVVPTVFLFCLRVPCIMYLFSVFFCTVFAFVFFSCCCCCYIVVGFLLSFSPCVFRVIVLHIFLPFNFFPKKTTCCAPPCSINDNKRIQMNLMLSQPKCEDPPMTHVEDFCVCLCLCCSLVLVLVLVRVFVFVLTKNTSHSHTTHMCGV